MHHLLSHTSHIADYAEEERPGPGRVRVALDRPPLLPVERPADFLPLFADRAPYGPPGGEFHYSNAGYVLLGLVAEEVTGLSYVDAVGGRCSSRPG